MLGGDRSSFGCVPQLLRNGCGHVAAARHVRAATAADNALALAAVVAVGHAAAEPGCSPDCEVAMSEKGTDVP